MKDDKNSLFRKPNKSEQIVYSVGAGILSIIFLASTIMFGVIHLKGNSSFVLPFSISLFFFLLCLWLLIRLVFTTSKRLSNENVSRLSYIFIIIGIISISVSFTVSGRESISLAAIGLIGISLGITNLVRSKSHDS